MNSLIEINNVALGIKEWKDQRVITFKDIDRVHERPDGTARKRFNDNRKRLVINEDYFIVHPLDIQMSENSTLGFSVPNRGLTLLTESGYLMLVKSLTDDLAWDVQRKLVGSYFGRNSSIKHSLNTTAMNTIVDTLTQMQQDISELKETQSKQVQPLKKKYTRWSTKMYPKYLLLMEYFNISRTELYHNLYKELENTYPDIDLDQLQEDYCYIHGLDKCFLLEAIEHTRHIRDLFELLVDSLLDKYNLCSEVETDELKRSTIFDD